MAKLGRGRMAARVAGGADILARRAANIAAGTRGPRTRRRSRKAGGKDTALRFTTHRGRMAAVGG